MFEAFVTLCALEAAGACREALLPGHAAPDRAACEAHLEAAAARLAGLGPTGVPYCAPRPPSRLAFEEIADGVHVHRGAIAEPDRQNRGDTSNIAFVTGTDAIAVIDAGASRAIGEQVYLAIRAVSEAPIRHVILTHMHPDHVFGAEPLREAGAAVIAHERLPRALADRAQTYLDRFSALIGQQGFLGTAPPEIDAVASRATRLDLGERMLELVPRATAHTTNDLTVLDAESGLLFGGDLVFSEHIPTLDGSLRGWITVLDAMAQEPAAGLVPGHGGPLLNWPEGAEPVLSYLGALVEDSRAAIDDGESLSEAVEHIGRSEAGDWALFDLYNPRNATVAYTELEWD
jgi:quinoprotein relay system zinc metallohydrolase 2